MIRRAMLVVVLLALATGGLGDAPPLFCAVIADTQKGDGDPFEDFAWGIERVNEIAPACVLFPGDLTNTAIEDQYDHFTAVAGNCEVPIYYAVGNHGAVPGEEIYRERFEQRMGMPTWYHREVGGWHVIALDSVRFVEGKLQHDGIIDDEQLAWVKRELASIAADEPIILMEHHPIAIENDGLQNADELLALFAGHNLAYTLTGHFHRNAVMRDASGLLHIITGSLSFSLEKDTRDIGYRLISTVGDDLWTCWIERNDGPALDIIDMVDGPGAIDGRWSGPGLFETAIPGGSRVALRVGYVGEGLTIKSGARILAELPASDGAADALVIVSEKNSEYLAEQDIPEFTVKPDGETHLSHIAVCTTDAEWEKHSPAAR